MTTTATAHSAVAQAGPTAIDRGLQRVGAVIMAFYLLNAVVLFAPRASDARPESTGFIIFGCSAGVATIARAALTRLSWVDVVTTVAAMVAALALNDLWNTAGIGDAGGPASAMLTVAVLAQILALPLPTVGYTAATTILIYATGRGLTLGVAGWWDGIEEGVALGAYVIAFYAAIGMLRQADAKAAAAAAQEARAHEERVAARAAQAADRESQRILHDDVIASLLAIDLARGTGDGGAVRSAARRARDAFERLETSKRINEESIAAPTLVAITPHYTGDHRTHDFIPEEVETALTLATSEAIRNAERHAGVDYVWVHRAVKSRSVTVTIRDDGKGFEADESTGFGVAHGIFGRMRDVGGSAHIQSQPGGGTAVTLTWEAAEATAEDDELTRVVIPRLTLLAAITLGILTLLPLRHIWTSHDPMLLGTVGVASFAATLALAEASARQRRSILALSAVAVQLVLLTANALLIDPVRLPNFDLWMIIFVDGCLTVIAFAFPVPLSLFCGVSASAYLVLLTGVSDNVSTASAGAVLEPLLVSLGATGLTASIRQARRVASERERQASTSSEAAASAIKTAEALRERLAVLRGSVLPFLNGLEDGTIDATDPESLARARALAQEARDELYLHRVLDDDLRDLLRRARAAGCDLTIRAPESGGATPQAAMLLRHALDPRRTEHAVVVLPHNRAGETRMRMSPPLASDAIDRLRTALSAFDVRVASDAETTTVSVGG